jgi:hypothetical protein
MTTLEIIEQEKKLRTKVEDLVIAIKSLKPDCKKVENKSEFIEKVEKDERLAVKELFSLYIRASKDYDDFSHNEWDSRYKPTAKQ